MDEIPKEFVPFKVEYEPVLHHVIYEGDKAHASPQEGMLIVETIDDRGVKWRYSFIAFPKMIVQAPASDFERRFVREVSKLWKCIFGG